MLFSGLLITLLYSVNIVFAAITTQLVLTTNIAGDVLTRTSIYDNTAATAATAANVYTTTDANGILTTVTGTATTPVTATNTATAVTNTGVQTITYTSTDPNGIVLTRTTVTNVGSLTASTTGTTGTTDDADDLTQTGLITSTYTSTDPNGVTLTRTTTYALTSSVTTGTNTNTIDSSSSQTSKTTTGSYVNNGRPDPSTSMTPYPLSAVTTLSMDNYYTVTQGTTKTYTSSRAHTTIYATVVISGQTIVRSTTFAQRFSSQYTAVAVPSSGSIGLGSLTGTIGVIKTNMKTTIKYNNAENLNLNSLTFFGLFTLFISLWI